MTTNGKHLLEVSDLRVRFPTPRGVLRAVDGVGFGIEPGERVAVVGESGSGKSMTALSLIGLTPYPGQLTGSVRFKGEELVGRSERALTKVRGCQIGLILQDAAAALDPLKTIGDQIAEALRLHLDIDRDEAKGRALELLGKVRISDPELRAAQYSHELSGGMAQRAITASVIGLEPDLLIADEPTSALDATTAEGVLDLIMDLGSEHGMATLLITHDLGVVARFAERVIVMYAGRIVEEGPVDELFTNPRHPYTRGLLRSVPGARGHRAVMAIPGGVPDLISPPSGCSFHPRCRLCDGREVCMTDEPGLLPVGDRHRAACHFTAELEEFAGPAPASEGGGRGDRSTLLELSGVSKDFEVKGGLFQQGGVVSAVQDVSLTVKRGEILALVGESGCGKSTTGRMILGLDDPSAGTISFDGSEIAGPDGRRDSEVRRRIQVVFQNPNSSLDPRMKIEDVIAEPLDVHGIGTKKERRERVVDLLEQVGLSSDHLGRYPFEFSGGQRQRLAIARALAPEPDFIVCDEPLTALDVSVQAQILNLLQDIQAERELTYLFIAHDLSVVRQIADRVAVMYLGRMVELADAEKFFEQPRHPYSTALISAMSTPDPDVERGREKVVLEGALPSPFDPPSGCPFHTRCWKADERCVAELPPLEEISPGSLGRCHYPEGFEDERHPVAVGAGRGEAK